MIPSACPTPGNTAAAEYGCDVSVSLGAALLMRTKLANDSLAEHDE